MALILDSNARYDMPASFGPSAVPDVTVVTQAEVLVLAYKTCAKSSNTLIPNYFIADPEPTLTISHVTYRNVDYLGGRDYNEIVVTLGATANDRGRSVNAGFALVLWVDQPGAMVAGREYMGLPKILGHVSNLQADMDTLRFTCAEYEQVFLTGTATDLGPFPPDRLQRLNTSAAEVRTFGWRYLPAYGGGADLDQPTINMMRWNYQQAWSGTGSVEFAVPRFAAAPMSTAAIRAVADLPRLSPVRAFRGCGSARIDRNETRLLVAA